MRIILGAALVGLVSLAGADRAAALVGTVIDVAAGEAIDTPTLERRLRRADVVILGEVHDNPAHHRLQAELVAAIAPAALSFEMLGPEDERVVARLRAQGAPVAVLGAALRWADRGWPDFAMYGPIFEAAPRAEVTGGAVDMQGMQVAMRDGAGAAGATVLGAAARRYRLEEPYDAATQEAATAEQVRAHCDAIPAEVGARMVEAQRLRDAAFADAVLRARALADDGRVVLIAGAGHARFDRGVPYYLEHAAPGLSVVALAFVEAGEGDDWRAQAPAPVPFDYLVFTEGHPREDPCLAFRRARE